MSYFIRRRDGAPGVAQLIVYDIKARLSGIRYRSFA